MCFRGCFYLLCCRVLGSSGRLSVVWEMGSDPCLPADMLPWRKEGKRQIENRNKQIQQVKSDFQGRKTFNWLRRPTYPCLCGRHIGLVNAHKWFLVVLRGTITWWDIRPWGWWIWRQRNGRLIGVLGWKKTTECSHQILCPTRNPRFEKRQGFIDINSISRQWFPLIHRWTSGGKKKNQWILNKSLISGKPATSRTETEKIPFSWKINAFRFWW